MEREHKPVGHSGMHYFGIYVDPDPFKGKRGLEVNNIRIKKSERNQRIADQHKAERKLRLPHGQLTEAERAILRIQRQERLVGVDLYVRDAVPSHSKTLIPEIIDCA